MKIHSLYVQPEKHGRHIPVNSINTIAHLCIVHDRHQHFLSPRHVLIPSLETVTSIGLNPSDLHENIVIKGYPVDSIPSGTIISIGEVQIRITFACEPCSIIATLGIEKPASIMGRRGGFGGSDE